MGTAKFDPNHTRTLIAVSSDDGETPENVYVDPDTHELLVTNTGGLTPGSGYDYIDVQQTDADTETFVFKTGGAGGTTVQTITINYTNSTKANIDNVAWT